jgi:hypothetical protein
MTPAKMKTEAVMFAASKCACPRVMARMPAITGWM